jgi:peptidoglycan/LPS O-acetylase OafA/YrhL
MRNERYIQVDALRAFAVTAVVATHTLGPWANTGTTGVLLFFVISGFLITGILLDTRSAAEESGESRIRVLRSFYARRALRIFPLYYLTLAFGMALNVPPLRENFGWNFLFLSNWRIALDRDWGVVPHIWSLAVEEQFYLVWPLIVLFAPRRAVPWVIGGMIAAAPVTRAALSTFTDIWVDAPALITPGTFDSLGLGALLALLWRTSRNTDRIVAWLGAIAIAVFALDFSGRWVPWIADFGSVTQIRWPLLFAWCLHRAARGVNGPVGILLRWRPVRFVGTISYAIYLFHLFVIPTAEFVQNRIAFDLHVPDRGFARFFLVFAVSIVLAAASWKFLERPINNQKHRFPYLQTKVDARHAAVARQSTQPYPT